MHVFLRKESLTYVHVRADPRISTFVDDLMMSIRKMQTKSDEETFSDLSSLSNALRYLKISMRETRNGHNHKSSMID
jgi:hypothetical protein